MEFSRKISAITLMLLFLISSWSSVPNQLKSESSTFNDYFSKTQIVSWESEWIKSEPVEMSSDFGGGPSITMKWLSGQMQIQKCNSETCPKISPLATEWLERDSLTLLLIFNRPGPTLEVQEKLNEYGIKLNKNPWRDNIDTPSVDESRLISSLDQEFVDEYTLDLIKSMNQNFDIEDIPISPPKEWSLGAWGAWISASMGSQKDMLHAPLSYNQDYWRIGDVWFASATPGDITNFVSNNIWEKISKEIPNLVLIDLDLKIKIETPLNEDRKWTGTDTSLDPGIPSAWDHTSLNTIPLPLRGDAIRIADFDTGIDVFHPAFFNPSNVPVNWFDDNGNSIFEWGVDGIDYDGDGQLSTNEILNRIAADTTFSINKDTYYLDLDENGNHNHGPAALYNDSFPGFGEPMYQANDLNSDGILSSNENFLLLDESTILATYDPDSGERVRGSNLTETAPDTNGHGTSVQGIIAANNAKHFYSGLSPNADLLSNDAFAGGFANAQSWATQRNADVMLYEVGSWSGEFLDGTSPVELSLDQMANSGIVQINPAGNLADSGKVIQGLLPDVDDTIGPLTTKFKVKSNNRPTSTWLTYVIPSGNNISFVEITKPGGSPVDVSNSAGWVDLGNDDWVWVERDTSVRNTNMLILAFSNGNGLTADMWNIALAGSSGQGSVLFRGYESDSVSSWGGGSNWREPSPSSLASIGDNGSVTWPATADNAITIASWATRGRGGVSAGELSKFSSRGTRINDGMPLVDIASPGNYDVWAPKTSQSGADFGSYHWFSGTSAAGPGAAAIAALMLQDNPGVGHHEIWNILNATAHWNSTTGELWNYSKRLLGINGNPTDVVGAVQYSNGTWGLSQPYGTPLGNGIRVGDPVPGTHAPDVDWGWGYIRADRATDRDSISPHLFLQSYVSFESHELTDIPILVSDNAIGDGNPVMMNITCNENQNNNWVEIDFQENIPLTPGTGSSTSNIGCIFTSIGWNSISVEVTDYSNNKIFATINVTTVFGDPVKIVSSTPLVQSITTDEILEIEGRVQNAWGAERPVKPQEWYDGLTPLTGFSIESSSDGYVQLDPISVGQQNLSINLYNSSVIFEIDVLRGINHHVQYRVIPPSSGLTDEFGNFIFTPDEPIHFEMRWYDEDNNAGEWEYYVGNQAGYVEINDDFTEEYINATEAEMNDPLIGYWTNNEFYPLRSGQTNLWLGEENANGELSIASLSIFVESGKPRELYLAEIENNSVELVAGEPWIAKLYGYDVGYNTVEIGSYQWELIQSNTDLELARAGLIKTKVNNDDHFTLSQNIAGIHLLEAITTIEGIQLSLNVEMNISASNPEVLIVNPSIIETYAGENFDINATLYDKYGNKLNQSMIDITYTSGICNCISEKGNWKINKTGVEYLYLQSGETTNTVEIRVLSNGATNVEVTLGSTILWGYESLEIGSSGFLNITATDGYNNFVDLETSSIIIDEVEEGLILDNLEVTALSRGNNTISGKIINEDGSEVNFEITIHVWGDQITEPTDEVNGNNMEGVTKDKLSFSEFISQNYIQLIWVFALVYLFIILGLMRNSKKKRAKDESIFEFEDW